MHKKPVYYQTPLRTRKAIVDWIFLNTHQRNHPFCFNVKVYQVDFSWENLLKLWRKYEGDPVYSHNDDWLRAAKLLFYDLSENTLWEWAIETACSLFSGDSDSFTSLWDGTNIDVVYSFEGRSGGWLSVNKFQRHNFTDRSYDARETLMEMDYGILRQFYQLIVMLNHDLQREAIRKELEHDAAFTFFANVCAAIPQPVAIQRMFSFANDSSMANSMACI